MVVAMGTFAEELCTDDFFFSPSGVHPGHSLSRRNTEVVGVSTLVNTKVTFPPRLVLKKRIAVGWLGPLFSGVPLWPRGGPVYIIPKKRLFLSVLLSGKGKIRSRCICIEWCVGGRWGESFIRKYSFGETTSIKPSISRQGWGHLGHSHVGKSLQARAFSFSFPRANLTRIPLDILLSAYKWNPS